MSEIRTADGKLVVSPGRGEPQHAAVVVTLVVMIGLLASIAAVIGLLAQPDAVPVVTARGGTAELFGGGDYRYDTLFSGAGNRGTDAVTVLIAIPLLVASLFGYRRGSLRWGSMLTGALAWFLYSYATMAVGAAFNQLFLVYVALFSASLWAFMIAIRDIDITRLARAASAAATRPGGADARQRRGDRGDLARPDPGRAARGRSVAATGWLHDRGDHGDRRSRVAPAAFAAGLLILRRSAFGYLMAFPLLLLEAMLAPMITAQTISQIAAGVSLSPGEMIGPVAGFVVLTGVAIWFLAMIARSIEGSAGRG